MRAKIARMGVFMNQILVVPNNKKIFFYKIELIFSLFVVFCAIFYILFSMYFPLNTNAYSKILDSYNISSLYSTTKVNLDSTRHPLAPFILGTISIEKIRNNISYNF